MSALTADQVDAVAARHPEVFKANPARRLAPVLGLCAILLYGLYAWNFFSVSRVMGEANWGIAGSYLADWVSYEVRPDIEFEPAGLKVRYPRFSAWGGDRQPDWLRTDGHAAEVAIGDAQLQVSSADVSIRRGRDLLRFAIEPGVAVRPLDPLPAWVEQREAGGRVVADFGFAGRVEIENDEVKVRARFLGWENFVFDGSSPFWGLSGGEIWRLVTSGDELKPGTSNLALAIDNIWNNAEWQHGDVWTKLLQTVVMAFIGTLFASLLALPLSFLAARNMTPNRAGNFLAKRLFDFLRSVDMLIWALFYTRAFGPGPLAGIAAIFTTDTGTLGKTFSEALENTDDRQREGVRSVGAAPILVHRYGVLPQVLPVFLSQSLYFWESNTRSATIIGAVGAGGIGLKLWEAMRTNQDWENVGYMVLLIVGVVFVFDNVSNALRSRLIGRAS